LLKNNLLASQFKRHASTQLLRLNDRRSPSESARGAGGAICQDEKVPATCDVAAFRVRHSRRPLKADRRYGTALRAGSRNHLPGGTAFDRLPPSSFRI